MLARASHARHRAAQRAAPPVSIPWSWTLVSAIALGCAAQLAACGGDAAAASPAPSVQRASPETTMLPESLWGTDGRAKAASPAGGTAVQWSGQRYATREQLAFEELTAAPYTLVIDADDEAAVASGLQLADTVHTHAGGKTLLGVFVRSRHPALAARLAERLTLEQGWDHVFVVH